MHIQFEILDLKEIHRIIPLIQKLTEHKFSDAILNERFAEMATQNYECAVIFDGDKLIGVTGIWYSTRHYVGKSAEIDHVFIEEAYRSQGIGKQFLSWIYSHVKSKGCEAAELNTYVQNYPSHKFYYNEGFEILGYHFLKKL
ncbi:GNAT family N-acetyltransferase [Psychroserpens sp.]|uniref:GNAT family N-acetyltransferase n=1 Tax=Psychroserpens sp. TaxID=2020870 RepID=UPI001B14C4C3|nr:GNAT family N-acetyltransferase [Psychroserpens sp.]MBO6605929.1 GNAT family N-acetyltransferase [Psychroserpens sp.]MBO6631025.1 GNAT family N-acetyltransferase [Psychroserpens sp.]MBO6652700.1 GNAT family N-acetyltransferase [Psychroserpens sp.]MBO6681528.1 GNAT family N-acetyltransferase [Psychroserpens sp.]MBO6749303.1 GNAT family N-acetyltransferase [Psychroserpens sp.]